MSVGTSRDRKRRVRSAKSRDENDAVEEGEETSWKEEGRRPPSSSSSSAYTYRGGKPATTSSEGGKRRRRGKAPLTHTHTSTTLSFPLSRVSRRKRGMLRGRVEVRGGGGVEHARCGYQPSTARGEM